MPRQTPQLVVLSLHDRLRAAGLLNEPNNVLVVPTTALTTAWARITTQAHPVLAVLLGLPNTVMEALDGSTAHEVGMLLGATGGRGELAAGHVVWCAQRGWPILTADAGPLRQLDPDLDIEELP